MKKKIDFSRIMTLYLPLFLLLLFALFPYIWTILSSIKPESELFARQIHYLPQSPTFQNYISLFKFTNFSKYLANSIVVALSTVLVAITVSTLAAYSFARFSFPMKNILLLIVLVTTMFPKILLIIPLFKIFAYLKMMNTYTALILAHSTFAIPFSVWMLTGYLEMIPKQLDEAAWIDGCTKTQVLFKIILPISVLSMAFVTILIIICFNLFLSIVIYSGTFSLIS